MYIEKMLDFFSKKTGWIQQILSQSQIVNYVENQNIKFKELLSIPNFVDYINAKHTPPSFKHIITETRYMTFWSML